MALIACDGPFRVTFNHRVICDNGLYLVEEDSIGAVNAIQELADILNSMFAQPTTPEMVAAFSIGISLPLMSYIVAWGYGVVINFMGSSDESAYLDD